MVVFFVSFALWLRLFSGVYRIPAAAPTRAPSNVGGGGGSVGILTMTWQVRKEHVIITLVNSPSWQNGSFSMHVSFAFFFLVYPFIQLFFILSIKFLKHTFCSKSIHYNALDIKT